MSDIVKISASPKQLSKLRNGHKVRVKPAMEGQGICMIVRPGTYDVVTRAFGRNKGVEISLSPEEILANQQASSQMAGSGIFGDLAKKALKSVAKMGIDVGANYAKGKLNGEGFFGDLAKKAVKSGASMAVDAGANYAKDRLAGSGGFVSNIGGTNGSRVHHSASLAQQVEQGRALEALNLATGMNTGYMGRAGLGTAMANADRARFIKGGVKEAVQGRGMGGMGRARLSSDIEELRKFRRSGGQVGAIGQSVLPPALQSQPYSENFQFQFTLPPAFQRIR